MYATATEEQKVKWLRNALKQAMTFHFLTAKYPCLFCHHPSISEEQTIVP
jgi:hypothetical protein